MAEEFRFMPLGLIRLRTLSAQCMGYLGATLTQVFTRADVSLRDVTIVQMGNEVRDCRWHHAPEACGGFGGFWKSQLVEFCLGRRRLTFACSPKPGQWPCGGTTRVGVGCDGKVLIERMCISLPYVETFNSKVIKGFLPELRSRKCFSCFEIPMFYVYMLWTFYVRFPYSCMGMLHYHWIVRGSWN